MDPRPGLLSSPLAQLHRFRCFVVTLPSTRLKGRQDREQDGGRTMTTGLAGCLGPWQVDPAKPHN